VGGAPQAAVNNVGGKVVVVDEDAFNDGTYYNSNDNALFAANIFDWLVGGGDVPWLSEEPITGTVSAESYSDVVVTFTALPTMTSGVYTASLIVSTDDAVNSSVEVPVTMTIVGAANCSFISSSPDDVGSTTYFTNTSTGDPPLTSRWDFGDGSPVSAAQNPTHDYAEAGWYTVILTVTNQPAGYPEFTSVCSDVVFIYGPPIADFDWSAPAIINQSVAFTDTSFSNPGGTNWSWQFGAGQGSSFVQNPIYTYTTAGDYVVTMMIDNGYGTDTVTDVVRVFESSCLPIDGVDFSWVEDPALFVSFEGSATQGTAQLPVTYTWDFGDGYFGVGQAMTHTYALSTTVSYTVSLTVANVCPSQQTIQKVIELWPYTIYLPFVTK
jgi:PKD repeat protein